MPKFEIRSWRTLWVPVDRREHQSSLFSLAKESHLISLTISQSGIQMVIFPDRESPTQTASMHPTPDSSLLEGLILALERVQRATLRVLERRHASLSEGPILISDAERVIQTLKSSLPLKESSAGSLLQLECSAFSERLAAFLESHPSAPQKDLRQLLLGYQFLARTLSDVKLALPPSAPSSERTKETELRAA